MSCELSILGSRPFACGTSLSQSFDRVVRWSGDRGEEGEGQRGGSSGKYFNRA